MFTEMETESYSNLMNCHLLCTNLTESAFSSKLCVCHWSGSLEVNEQTSSHICTEQIIFFTAHDKLKELLSDRPICQSNTEYGGSLLCIILHYRSNITSNCTPGRNGQLRLPSPKGVIEILYYFWVLCIPRVISEIIIITAKRRVREEEEIKKSSFLGVWMCGRMCGYIYYRTFMSVFLFYSRN